MTAATRLVRISFLRIRSFSGALSAVPGVLEKLLPHLFTANMDAAAHAQAIQQAKFNFIYAPMALAGVGSIFSIIGTLNADLGITTDHERWSCDLWRR